MPHISQNLITQITQNKNNIIYAANLLILLPKMPPKSGRKS
jgi:hypothetical protein